VVSLGNDGERALTNFLGHRIGSDLFIEDHGLTNPQFWPTREKTKGKINGR
jgi:hypothetical protein